MAMVSTTLGCSHDHGLEAAFEGFVLLDVFAVLVEGGGADAAQFAAGQSRLEQVGGVDRAFGSSGADQGVELVDEEDDFPFRAADFFEHGFETVLEFPAVFGAGDQGAEIEGQQPFAAQRLGAVPLGDAGRDALDHRGLADPGFTDQHGVVLGAPTEDLRGAADLLVAPDHRIELVGSGQLREVAGVALEGFVLTLGILVGDPLTASHVTQGGHERVAVDPGVGQCVGGVRALFTDDC